MQQEHLDILQGSFLFEHLPPAEVENFCAGLAWESYVPGQEIYAAHRFRPAIAILLEGRANVTNSNGLPMQRLGPGDCFGVAAVFGNVREYVTTVTAVTAVTLIFITDSQLQALFAQCPQSAVNYIAFLSGKICFLNRKLDSLTANTAQESLLLWLRRNQAGGCVQVNNGYTALARELNLGRASLYRALDSLEAQGIITRQGRAICIKEDETDE